MYSPKKIHIGKSKIPNSGKGVFASENIKKGEIIEIAPILVLVYSDLVETKWNLLFEYYFWMDDFVVLASLWDKKRWLPLCLFSINSNFLRILRNSLALIGDRPLIT